MALQASIPGPRRQPSLLTASILALGGRFFRMRVSTARSFRTCHLARPLSPVTLLPNSSVSSRDGAEGVKSTSVSDEDGLAKPESALLEPDSPESEEVVEESEVARAGIERASSPRPHVKGVGFPRVGFGSVRVLGLGFR
jgi:hypothetical protein